MNASRYSVILILFTLLCLAIFFVSMTDHFIVLSQPLQYENEKKDSINTFTIVNYYKYEENNPLVMLDAIHIDIVNNGERVIATDPVGIYYSNTGIINYKAEKGNIDNIAKTLQLTGKAHLYTATRDFKSPNIFYDMTTELVKARDGVENESRPNKNERYFIKAIELDAYMNTEKAFYRKQVDGKIIRTRAYEPPVYFKGEKLDLDMKLNQADFTQGVWIKRGNMQATARKGVIYLENYNKKLKYSVLNDDVRLIERFKNSANIKVERRAFSEKLEVYNRERKIVMTGAPRVIQGSDVIKGNRITLKEKTELVEIDDSKSSFRLR